MTRDPFEDAITSKPIVRKSDSGWALGHGKKRVNRDRAAQPTPDEYSLEAANRDPRPEVDEHERPEHPHDHRSRGQQKDRAHAAIGFLVLRPAVRLFRYGSIEYTKKVSLQTAISQQK